MKNLFTLTVLLALLDFSAFAASRAPLNRAYLQSNLDGNGKSITNLLILRVGTVIADQVVGGGAGLSNVVASVVLPGISLTNVTIKGGTFYGDGSGLSNVVAGSSSALASGSSLTNMILKGGSIEYMDGYGLTNVPATSLFYPTNLGTTVITFGGFVEYRDYGTNAAFAWGGFTGVSHTNVQTVVYFVTNSTASVWNVTPPPGMLATNGTWNVTNVTAFTFINNGKKWTNGTAQPIK